jgi:phosphohistidine phosphatase
MKSLYLLRHAKSSWSIPGLGDQQRPLNNRGSSDAPMMGQRFKQRGEHLDHIVSSPALRAHTTAELFAQACGFESDAIEINADLYFLGNGSIEDVILAQDDALKSLMLVFHNPDITHFANSIDYDFHVDNIPTCGLIKLSCDIAQWRDWSRGNTVFDYFDFPKNEAKVVQHSSST